MKKTHGVFTSAAAILVAGSLFAGPAHAGSKSDKFAEAIFKHDVATVKDMLLDGFRPDGKIPYRLPTKDSASGKRPALYVAAAWGNPEIVELMLNAGGKQKSAICMSAQFGWPKVTKLLLESGIKANASCKGGKPNPLLRAKEGASGKMSKGTAGKTFGTKAQFEETVKILMAAGAK